MVEIRNLFKKDKKKETVEDILKKEGVIKPLPKKKTEKPLEEKGEVSDSKILMSIEKLRAEIEMLKDSKAQIDDRIRDITEKMGEFRSLVFQRESLIKELESKIRIQEEEIFNIKPRIIEKEIDTRKKEIGDNQIRIEKLEAMSKDILKDVKEAKEILENIKSIENIQKMLDETRKRVETIEKAKADVDRLAGKSERFYIEINERMKDFVALKAKTENLDELTKEMTKSIDSVNIRLGAFSSRDDLDNFKNTIDDILAENKEKIENRVSELEKYMKIPEAETRKRIEELREREKNISKLLNDLERKYKKAEISENTYKETKEKNEELIKKIAEEINELEGGESFSMKSLPSMITDLKTRIGRLESFNSSLREEVLAHRNFLGRNVKEIHKKIDNVQIEGGFTEEYKGTMKTQTEIMRSTLEAIKKLNEKMNNITENVKIFDLRIRFFETLSMLIRVQNEEEINFYLSEVEKIIAEMKSRNMWDQIKENMVLGLLSDISYNWKEYEYEDIAKIFDEEIRKIEGPSK